MNIFLVANFKCRLFYLTLIATIWSNLLYVILDSTINVILYQRIYFNFYNRYFFVSFNKKKKCNHCNSNLILLQAQALFVDNFWPKSRLDHVSLVMGYHPSYLNHFLKTQNFILKGDGPLPYDYRHYIAIMVSKKHVEFNV